MNEQERKKNWELVKRGQKPDTEIKTNWVPPKLEGEQYKSEKDRLDQFKNAYMNTLKEMNDNFGTNAKLMDVKNNFNGSYTVTTLWSPQDIKKQKANSQDFDNFLNKQLQQKLNPQNILANQYQNISDQQNINPSSTYTSPTPLRTKPKNPNQIS